MQKDILRYKTVKRLGEDGVDRVKPEQARLSIPLIEEI
jgi:hypothetical protein